VSSNDRSLERVEPEGRADLPLRSNAPPRAEYGARPNAGHPRPLGQAHDEETLDVRRVIWGLMRRRRQILAVAVLVLIPAAIATALAERLYRSSAMVQIDPEPMQVLPYREFDLPSLTPNYEMFMKSQEQILRGTALISRVAGRLRSELGPEAGTLESEVPNLSGRLWLQRIENTQIFRLGYVATQPDVAARVANIYAEEYLKQHFDARQQTREKAKQQLEAELRALEEGVRNSDRELVSYAQAHGISTAENARSLIQEKLATLSTQLTEVEAEVFAARSRLDSLGKASVAQFPEALTTPVILGLVSRLTSLEAEKTALRATFGPNWGAVVQKDKEMALAREQLEREKSAAIEQARQQALLEIRTAEHKRALIAGSTAEQQQVANRLDTATLQYNMIKGEADKNRKLYDGVLEQLKKTSLTSGMEFGGFRVIEQALPPRSVDSPRPLWNLSLAAILGLALGMCIAFVRDYWDTSVATVEDVEQLELLPVLGTLPLVQMPSPPRHLLGRVRRRLPAAAREAGISLASREDPGANQLAAAAIDLPANPMAAEDVRTICASLLLSRSGRPPRTLLITSAAPGEGKTTLAAALAQTLADTGAGTLLVDCDVRRGRLGSIFDITTDGGLTLYLAGHVAPAPTIHATANDNLFVVTAGPSAPNPPALLGSDRMKSFLTEMTSSFQFVILDAPPVMPLADARVLAQMVEGVVLIVRTGRASKSMIRRACLFLESAGGTVLGAVLNGVDDRGPDSPYHYYRDYYKN
jgi:succinoglycan biosynthesis transport protein ExoP